MNSKARKIGLIGLFAAAIAFFGAPAVQAQINTGIEYGASTGLAGGDIRTIIGFIIQAFLGILGVVALVLIIYAGWLWMTAGGDEEKVSHAKRILTQAVIGLIIILASFAITTFVISRLVEATTGTPGGPGGPGPGGPLPSTQFTVDAITPPDSKDADFLWPKNSLVRIVFRNGSPDPATMNGAIAVESGGTPISGTLAAQGNSVVFTPTAECTENPAYTCLPGDTVFNVSVGGAIRSLTGGIIFCGKCWATFRTGDFIDTQNPTVSIATPVNGQPVPVDSFVPIIAQADDDSAVAEVEFFANDVSLGAAGSDPWQIDWDTAGIPIGTEVRLQAMATDAVGNTALSAPVTVTVRPAHCFDGIPNNGGETGLDCGDGCGACEGDSCTQNSDCASGLCQNGKCINRPRIDLVEPLSGGPGTLVTIAGASFGPGPGEVLFLGTPAAGDEKVAEPCAPGAWTNSQIIISLPEGTVSGPIQVTNRDNLSDRTDDDFGNISIPDFAVNTEVKPGICLLTPDNGPSGTSVQIAGIGFGDDRGASTVTVAGRNADISSWSGLSIVMAVPNILGGRWPVTVTAAGNDSNSAAFSIPTGIGKPHILSVEPDSGPVGEYVTITGSDFGSTPGKVEFISGNDSAIGGTDFPPACGNHFWSDISITVKVPLGLPEGDVKIGVTRADAVSSDNQADFEIVPGTPKPGICRIDPVSGPVGVAYELDGERLGNDIGKVIFRDNVDGASALSSWNTGRITGAVPGQAVTGRVYAVSAAAEQSNSLNFTVADCRAAKVCTGSQECCDDGACREPNADGSSGCVKMKLAGSYRYRFSTGDIPLTPAVVEDVTCAVRSQSPTPYKDVMSACVNSVIGARFTIPMDQTTLTSANFTVRDCGNGASFDVTKCAGTVAGTVASFGGGQPGDDGMVLTPDADLAPNEWYEAQIASTVLSAGGVPMDADYVWNFRVRDSSEPCTIESVTVSPAVNTLIDLYSEAAREGNENKTYTEYKANPQDALCNELKCESYSWDWACSTNAAQVVNPNICRPEVQALKETEEGTPAKITATAMTKTGSGDLTVKFVDPMVIDKWPACQTACLEAQVAASFNTAVTDVSSATVKFFKCNNETCQSPLEESGYTVEAMDADNEHLAVVHPALAADGSALEADTYYRVVVIGGPNGVKSHSGAQLVGINYAYGPSHMSAYSWVFRTGSSHCQVDFIGMTPAKIVTSIVGSMHAIEAVPKTAPDDCAKGGQRIDTDTLNFSWRYAPNPAGAAELFRNGSLNVRPLSSAYATSSCLRSGTAAAAVCGDGIVENGRGMRKVAGREAEGGGEECDLGVNNDPSGGLPDGTPSSGCSANCLLTGNAVCKDPTGSDCCGNGNVDAYTITNGVTVREQCDLGGENGRPESGCSGKCLRLGSNSTTPPSTCGNSDLADNEQCDLGRGNGPGTGCSSECLDEGSQPGGTSICGNSIAEAGEDCDPPDNKTCSAACKNMGTPACVVSGQSKCCGNAAVAGAADPGEDPGCDLGWDNVSKKPLVAQGCNASCLMAGASVNYTPPSVCGDAAIGLGETYDPGASGSAVDPLQYAQAVGQGRVMDAQGRMITQITASLNDKDGTAEFDLQCGYKSNADCPSNTYLGTNTCCFPRPIATIISPKGDSVCRNPAVEVDYDRPMDAASFVGNFTITGPVGPSGKCPSEAVSMGPLERLWSKIAAFFSKIVAFVTGRPAEAQAAACTIPGSVIVQNLTVNGVPQARVFFRLKAALDRNTTYSATINFNVKSSDGVSPGNTLWWTFTTGTDICTLDNLEVDPATALFTQVYSGTANPEAEGIFIARAQHNDPNGEAQPIAPVPGVYDWQIGWVSSDPTLVDAVSGSLPIDSDNVNVGVKKVENGQVTLGASASITTDVLNTPSTKGTAVIGSADITVLLCRNPWPARAADRSWSPYVGSAALGDSKYGYSFYYCRDDANGNVSLPELNSAPVVPAVLSSGAVFDQYLYTYTPASIGKSAARKTESIGLRIAANKLHLSPTEWYSTQSFKGNPTPTKVDGYEALAEGNTTYVSAAAVNTGVVSNGTDDYTDIFAWSYTAGASADTKDIYQQILANMRFVRDFKDFNVCNSDASVRCTSDLDCSVKTPGATCLADRSKIRRDVKRLADLRLVAEAAQNIKDYLGAYPQLASGSYLTGRSVSTWPSWGKALAQDLGGAPPTDPINKLGPCPDSGYEAATCWNASTQTFACPVGSRVYEYFTNPAAGFWLNANFESSADFIGAYCSGLSPDKCAVDPWCYVSGNSCLTHINNPSGDVCNGNQIGVRPATCGNGVIEAGEQCEKSVQATQTVSCSSGTGTETDSCGADCRWVLGSCVIGRCGNGVVETGEVCDNGKLNGTYGHCNAACTGIGLHCGDGLPQQGESCDNGASNGAWSRTLAGSCAFDCHGPGPYCGDSKVDPSNEQCDGASDSSPDEHGTVAACPNDATGRPQTHVNLCDGNCNWMGWGDCEPIGRCGNGTTESIEQCDDGSRNSDNNQCLASCRTASCGDGHVWVGHEQCDAGEFRSPYYGNIDPKTSWGQVAIREKQKDCLLESCYYCTTACTAEAVTGAYCGDGQTEGREQCDRGNENIDPANKDAISALEQGVEYCTTSCQKAFAPKCSDGLLNEGESCDAGDANGAAGSGCDSSCRCVGDGFYSGVLPGTVTGSSNYTTDAVPVTGPVTFQGGYWPKIQGATAVWAGETNLTTPYYFMFPFNLTHPAAAARIVIGADNEFEARLDDPNGAIITKSDLSYNSYQRPQFADIITQLKSDNTSHVLYVKAWNTSPGPAGLWFAIVTKPNCAAYNPELPKCVASGYTIYSDTNVMVTSVVNPHPVNPADVPSAFPIHASLIPNAGSSYGWWAAHQSDELIVGANWIWYTPNFNSFAKWYNSPQPDDDIAVFESRITLPGHPVSAAINVLADDAVRVIANNNAESCPLSSSGYCPSNNCSAQMAINHCDIIGVLNQDQENVIRFTVDNYNSFGGLLYKITFDSDCGLQ
jgi:hypothetical protein